MNWKSLRFFADENIAPEVIDFLRQGGYDVKSVVEEELSGKSDNFLIEHANNENRIIITHDSDFGKIVYTKSVEFKGIIFLRPGHFGTQISITTLKTLLLEDIKINLPFIVVAEYFKDRIKLRIKEFK